MKKRRKKPPVRPEVARKWLERYEEYGESPPQIAQSDGYDVRTVRKQLELMRHEREVREARQVVLRKALEKHYADLCSFAENLRAALSGDTPKHVSTSLKDDPMWTALREHLPRAPLWKTIEKWEGVTDEFHSSLERLGHRIREEATAKTSLEFVPSRGKVGLIDGFTEAVSSHLRSIARGEQGLEGLDYSTRDREQGILVQLELFRIALVPEAKVSSIQQACSSLMDEAVQWEEYARMQKSIQEFSETQRILRDELTKIILRRVLPGRCVYCPF